MFQNFHCFKNFRAENKGSNLYGIYQKQGNAFVHVAVVRIVGKVTAAKIEDALYA